MHCETISEVVSTSTFCTRWFFGPWVLVPRNLALNWNFGLKKCDKWRGCANKLWFADFRFHYFICFLGMWIEFVRMEQTTRKTTCSESVFVCQLCRCVCHDSSTAVPVNIFLHSFDDNISEPDDDLLLRLQTARILNSGVFFSKKFALFILNAVLYALLGCARKFVKGY